MGKAKASGMRPDLEGKNHCRPPWAPAWALTLGTAVWVTDPDRNISYINKRARALLGRSEGDCVGQPCYEVIGGKDVADEPFCGEDCRIHCQAERNREIEPVRMRVPNDGAGDHWIQLLTIAVRAPDHSGPWLVHCVLNDDRAHRIESYIERISSRTSAGKNNESHTEFSLSKRELEILRLLANDESLHAIAEKLNISYATVRNHVQHILHKLGVHSVMEAVACYLLLDG